MAKYSVTVRVVQTYVVPNIEAVNESDACLLAMDQVDRDNAPEPDSTDIPMDDCEAELQVD